MGEDPTERPRRRLYTPSSAARRLQGGALRTLPAGERVLPPLAEGARAGMAGPRERTAPGLHSLSVPFLPRPRGPVPKCPKPPRVCLSVCLLGFSSHPRHDPLLDPALGTRRALSLPEGAHPDRATGRWSQGGTRTHPKGLWGRAPPGSAGSRSEAKPEVGAQVGREGRPAFHTLGTTPAVSPDPLSREGVPTRDPRGGVGEGTGAHTPVPRHLGA